MRSRIIVLGGETDSGKTLQSLIYGEKDDRIRVIDTENRVQQTIEFHRIDRDIKVVNVLKTYTANDKKKNQIKYQPDFLASYHALRDEIEKCLDYTSNYDVLVIDGISPVRSQYCLAKWYSDNSGRKQPTSFEWAAINEDARQLLEPLIHMSRVEHKTIIFTAQMNDKYLKDKLVGRELDMRDWGKYNVDYIIELSRPVTEDGDIIDGQYTAKCTKSIIGSWQEDISGMRNLYDVFLELGI